MNLSLSARFRMETDGWPAYGKRLCYQNGILYFSIFRRRAASKHFSMTTITLLLTAIRQKAPMRYIICWVKSIWHWIGLYNGLLKRISLPAEIQRLLDAMEYNVSYTGVQLMEKLCLKSRDIFRELYFLLALEQALITMSNPEKPTSRNQAYIRKQQCTRSGDSLVIALHLSDRVSFFASVAAIVNQYLYANWSGQQTMTACRYFCRSAFRGRSA